MNIWAIQLDPKIQENPEEFIPERFENSQMDFKGQDFEFNPFGSGKMTCLAFELPSVEYILANLFHWFDWKLPEDGSPECEIDVSETYGLALKKRVPLFLQPIPFSSLQAQSP